jgi:cytochrome c oxidase cbb3-type subunit IV
VDVNDLRAAVTVLSLLAFIGIVAWAWSKSNQNRFFEAAQLPFGGEARQQLPPDSMGQEARDE